MIGLGVDHDDLVQKVKGNGKAGKPQSREPAKYYGGKAVHSLVMSLHVHQLV